LIQINFKVVLSEAGRFGELLVQLMTLADDFIPNHQIRFIYLKRSATCSQIYKHCKRM